MAHCLIMMISCFIFLLYDRTFSIVNGDLAMKAFD